MTEAEPKAKGWLNTTIECGNCSEVFDLSGDKDGEEIECPGCKLKVMVYREDK